jgi:hypothetical protein
VIATTELGVGDRRALWVVLADTPNLAVETPGRMAAMSIGSSQRCPRRPLNASGSGLVKRSFSKRLKSLPCLGKLFFGSPPQRPGWPASTIRSARYVRQHAVGAEAAWLLQTIMWLFASHWRTMDFAAFLARGNAGCALACDCKPPL